MPKKKYEPSLNFVMDQVATAAAIGAGLKLRAEEVVVRDAFLQEVCLPIPPMEDK